MRRQTPLLNFCFLLLSVGCASSRVNQLEDQNRTLQQRIAELDRDNSALAAKRAEQMAVEERTRADREPPEGYPSPGVWGNLFVPPPYVGFTERPPVGWGEAGNEARSVRLTNDWNPYNRYYLRIFLDNEELGFTDGVGTWQSMIQTSRGVRQVSFLRPNGQAMHRIGHGEHHLLVEAYSCDDFDCEYADKTCEWTVDFDGNLGLNGEWHFWGGKCHKSRPSD